ncbi:MAG: aminopeptidase P family protein [Pseudomonadota bacterium]
MFQNYDAPADGAQSLHSERISQLRELLVARKIDAYLVPRADAHQGEYVAPCDERLNWLTGFSGSAGQALIGRSEAALFVDGRYTLQAANQVPGSLFEIVESPKTSLDAWVKANLKRGSVIAFDPMLVTLQQFEKSSRALAELEIMFKPIAGNLIDKLWGEARPTPPTTPIVVQPLKHAGLSAAKKVAKLQADLDASGDDAVILTQPDSICWLLNIRGSDVAHNPVVLAFALVPKVGPVEVFTSPEKMTPAVSRHLDGLAVLREPAAFEARLKELNQRGTTVSVDPGKTPFWVTRRLSKANTPHRTDPCLLPKAIKTPAEIDGCRAAHLRDGAAMARFLAWLDRAIEAGEPVDEIGAAQKIEALRAETGQLKDISFDTISGSGPNGAIVHYRVTEMSNRRLRKGELFLLDSGGQYPDGTTDITRTIAIGQPTKTMVRHATLVLKGHIEIARVRFPVGTRGIDLDPLARNALWQFGLDYGHGTGHGVGSYLSVHEGPQSISRRGLQEIKPGMIISNEPGYYKTGAYGIRIENLVLVQDPETPSTGDRPMMSFETLTLAPIDTRLIDPTLLTDFERDWLNAYHARVAREIGPEVDPTTRRWLKAACQKI